MYEGGGWSTFYGKWVIGLRNGKGGASFTNQGLFFLLDSQVIQIFRLKNRLIILRVVRYVIRGRMCFRAAKDRPGNYWLTIFLETAAG